MMKMHSEVCLEGEMRDDDIETATNPTCPLCSAVGNVVYEGLRDRLFDAPGNWTLKRCPTNACGMVWLDPMPSPSDLWKAYRTYYTHSDHPGGQLKQDWARWLFRGVMSRLKASYIKLKYHYFSENNRFLATQLGWMAYVMPWRRSEWDLSVMFLPSVLDGRLLEVGCGSGDLLVGLKELGWKVEGIDVDPMAIENSKRKGLDVRRGTLEALSYPENSFDAVVMSHVIEHVHDPMNLLCECFRILKPGGRISFVTPNAQSLCHRMFGRAWFSLDPPRHLHIFTPKAMNAMMQRSGFHSARVFTSIRDADGLFAASRSIQRTGRAKMRSRQPRAEQIFGRIIQVLEWLLTKVDTSAGEELSVIAQK